MNDVNSPDISKMSNIIKAVHSSDLNIDNPDTDLGYFPNSEIDIAINAMNNSAIFLDIIYESDAYQNTFNMGLEVGFKNDILH